MLEKICIIIVAIEVALVLALLGVAWLSRIRMKRFSRESPKEQKRMREEWIIYL